MIDKDKAAAMPKGSTQQDKPTDTSKTLGDVIREALQRATGTADEAGKTEATGINQAMDDCQCPLCTLRRSFEKDVAAMKQENTKMRAVIRHVINAAGAHIDAAFEEEKGGFIFSFKGKGVDFVYTDNGEQGIRFNSREALEEFFEFVEHIEGTQP